MKKRKYTKRHPKWFKNQNQSQKKSTSKQFPPSSPPSGLVEEIDKLIVSELEKRFIAFARVIGFIRATELIKEERAKFKLFKV